MAEHKVVNADQLDADLTSVADSIRTKAGTSDKLAFPAGMKEAVDNLNTFVPPSSMALDPDEVYRSTRPKDWLPMPTPGDDEIYLLNLIPEGLDGAFTALIWFTGECAVEFGNLVDGVFVAKETVTPTSGTRFFHTVYWDDYGDETSDGYRQYLVRIKGGFTSVNFSPESSTVYSYGVPMLVDALSGAESDVAFSVNSTAEDNCRSLRYCRFVGNGRPKITCLNIFRYCTNLIAVSTEKELQVSTMQHSFAGCTKLVAVSKLFFTDSVSYHLAFYKSGIPAYPNKKIVPSTATSMFEEASGIVRIDGTYVDTSKCTSFDSFLYNCKTCLSVEKLDISSATNFYVAFKGTRLLNITFAGTTTPGGWTIDLSTSRMSHKALVNMINSLPTAISPATITITNNPGASELTDEEIAVATAKNWTVTI